MFQITLNTVLTVLLIGLIFQVYQFTRKRPALRQNPGKALELKERFRIDIPGGILNTLFQIKLFRAGKVRWLIHFVGITGFCYLVFFHALDDIVSYDLFDDYEPTVNPYQFLRNLAGFSVLAGCIGFLFKRVLNTRINHDKKFKYKGFFSILLILLVIVSGFLLEAVKIVSEPVFMEMIDDYSDLQGEPELGDLKAYWNEHYNAAFAPVLKVTGEMLENGEALNEEYCLDCHAPIKTAFVSSRIAVLMSNFAGWMNSNRHDITLYRIHYLLSFLMLMAFPFSRFFHIFLIPLATLKRPATDEQFKKETVSIPVAMLYACTNCGYCSQVCSVYPNLQITGNRSILPHVKIDFIKSMLSGAAIDPHEMNHLKSGNDHCTMCRNCTDICPSGIDLQGLWRVLDQKLVTMGYKDNYSRVKQRVDNEGIGAEPGSEKITSIEMTSHLSMDPDAFDPCIQCTICTNVCPVVEYDSEKNDLTPQQVLNFLRMEKRELATETRMVWNCLTCYACQEACPQGIKVTDILLALRNIGNMKADEIKLESI